MILGESGVLAVAEAHGTPWEYKPSTAHIITHTGSSIKSHSSERPDSLRGPEYDSGAVDEAASLKAMPGSDGLTALDNAFFTLRSIVPGLTPRVVLATTPKRVKSIRKLLLDAHDPANKIIITRGTTFENSANLDSSFREGIILQYANTSLGAQELNGEMVTDVDGAIFTSEMFEASRITDERDLPALLRPIIAVDPSAGDGTGDLCGVIVAAVSAGTIPTEVKHGALSVVRNLRHVYILEDASIAAPPDTWANLIVSLAERYDCRQIVAEGNQGREMVRSLIKARNPSLKVELVNARVGKEARAQPVAGLFAQGRAHLVGEFPDLVDECLIAGTMITTSRGQVPIEDVVPGDEVLTREGWAPVERSGKTGETDTLVGTHVVGSSIWSTENHPIWVESLHQFVPAKHVLSGDKLLSVSTPTEQHPVGSTGMDLGSSLTSGSTHPIGTTSSEGCSTDASMKHTMGGRRSSETGTYTTETGTQTTIRYGTLSCSTLGHMDLSTQVTVEGGGVYPQSNEVSSERRSGQPENLSHEYVRSVSLSIRPNPQFQNTVVSTLTTRRDALVSVYNLKVADGYLPEFYANGILVHNCTTWVPGSGGKSPDRLDAMCWSITYLEPSVGKRDLPPASPPSSFARTVNRR